jgi:hypothetical protein
MNTSDGKRSGRAARHAKRQDMTARAERVVTPGMTDGSFRERYPIKLETRAMRPGCGRW